MGKCAYNENAAAGSAKDCENTSIIGDAENRPNPDTGAKNLGLKQ